MFVLALARAGSFLAAANQVGVDQTTVSRRVQRLERRLGTKFFDRHAHGMEPTPAGRALIARACEMEEAARGIERHLAGADQQLAGDVRIAASEGVVTYWLTPVLMDFQLENPGIKVELITGTGPVDLLGREADFALRMFAPTESRFVTARVGTIHFSLFAAESYLREFGAPADLEDLMNHKIIQSLVYTSTSNLEWWHQFVRLHPNVILETDSRGGLIAAIKGGYGIGLLPNFYCTAEPSLRRLPLLVPCHSGLWLLSHEETNRSARVRAAMSFVRKRLKRDRASWFPDRPIESAA